MKKLAGVVICETSFKDLRRLSKRELPQTPPTTKKPKLGENSKGTDTVCRVNLTELESESLNLSLVIC